MLNWLFWCEICRQFQAFEESPLRSRRYIRCQRCKNWNVGFRPDPRDHEYTDIINNTLTNNQQQGEQVEL